MKRVAKVDAPVRQQTPSLKKFALCALKPLLYQLPSELAAPARRRPLQQRVEQVAFRLAVKAAVEALALRAAKPSVAPACRVRAQVELVLVERQKSQVAFDVQARRAQVRLKRVMAVASQRVLNHKEQAVANAAALALAQRAYVRVAQLQKLARLLLRQQTK